MIDLEKLFSGFLLATVVVGVFFAGRWQGRSDGLEQARAWRATAGLAYTTAMQCNDVRAAVAEIPEALGLPEPD